MEKVEEIYTIDGKNYTVISQTKEDANSDDIYNVFVRYALEKLQNT